MRIKIQQLLVFLTLLSGFRCMAEIINIELESPYSKTGGYTYTALGANSTNIVVESGEKIIVGVNKFTIDEAPTNIAFKIDDSIRQVQIEKINTIKQNRDNAKVAACLDAIITAAKGTDNIMPLVVEAVENKATLGEISNALRLVFGEF